MSWLTLPCVVVARMNTIRLEVDFGLQPSSQSEEEKQAEVMLKMDRLAAKDRLRAMYKDGTKPYTGPLPNARNAEYERKTRAEKKRREEEQRKAQAHSKYAARATVYAGGS